MVKDIHDNNLSKNQFFILNSIRDKISKTILDTEKSKSCQVDDFIIYRFYDYRKAMCPFILDFGINKQAELLNFYYNYSAPIVEIDLTNEDSSIYLEIIHILLQSKIKEEIKYTGNKIYSVKYYYNKSYKEIDNPCNHIRYVNPFLFWKRKRKEQNNYISWI